MELPIEIEVYAQTMLGPELFELVNRAFSIMYHFEEYKDTTAYTNLIFNYTNMNPADVQSDFFDIVNADLDRLLEEHMVFLIEDTTIQQKCEVLNALIVIGDFSLDTYRMFMPMLESAMAFDEKFIELVINTANITASEMYTILERVDPSVISLIKNNGYKLEHNATHSNEENEHIIEARYFNHFCEITHPQKAPLAIKLIRSGMKAGNPFASYLPFVESRRRASGHENYSDVALDIVSLCVISAEGLKDLSIRSGEYLSIANLDSGLQSKISFEVSNLITKYVTFKSKELEDAKVRVS